MLAKSENALGYRVKSLSPKNGGSFNVKFLWNIFIIYLLYFHYMFTICSLYAGEISKCLSL